MLETCLFPPDLGLQVTAVETQPTALLIRLAPTTPTAPCPICQEPATRIHSRYHRTLADLPCLDYAVRLDLHLRRFFCRTPQCPRWIFAERLPTLTRPWAQRTTRAAATLQQVGLALGGEAGARLLRPLHLPASPDTLLRLVRQLATADPRPTPRVLGVDDWALRKGRTYGTLLIDLETGLPVDLLPDREADTLAAWLEAHPGVEIISRDRAGAYAEGAQRGAPQAQQVADRWHILKNLGDALEDLLGRIAPTLTLPAPDALPPAPPADAALGAGAAPPTVALDPAAPKELPPRSHAEESSGAPPGLPPADPGGGAATVSAADVPSGSAPVVPPRRRRRDEQRSQSRRARRQERYAEVQRLHQLGWNYSAIAHEVGLDRETVRKWVQSPQCLEPRPRPRQKRQIDAYQEYVQQRWQEGCHNARQIWHEIQAQGYRGGYSQVAAYLAEVREAGGIPLHSGRGAARAAAPAPAVPSARQLRWVLWRPVAEWSDAEYELVRELSRQSGEFTLAYGLVGDFQALVQQRRPEELASWVRVALASGLAEFGSFARGVLRDFAAVYAGLEGKYSNGPVEGQVNRLKMLKRQLYGRAKFDLLRLRVLYAH